MNLVELKNVRKVFPGPNGNLEVIKDISFAIEKGSIVSIVGVSGCGKTTSLKLIAGLIESTAGVIENTAKNISYVPQSLALMPWLTVYKNVSFPLELTSNKLSKVEKKSKIEEVLRLVGLWNFRDSYINKLSGGEKQRVAIARALVTDPELLLMDEPFSSLDIITRENLNNELLRIWQELKPTIILVTHSPREAIRLSKRVVILSPRPAVVRDIIEIPFAYPRQSEIEFEPQFKDLLNRIWSGLEGGDKKT